MRLFNYYGITGYLQKRNRQFWPTRCPRIRHIPGVVGVRLKVVEAAGMCPVLLDMVDDRLGAVPVNLHSDRGAEHAIDLRHRIGGWRSGVLCQQPRRRSPPRSPN